MCHYLKGTKNDKDTSAMIHGLDIRKINFSLHSRTTWFSNRSSVRDCPHAIVDLTHRGASRFSIVFIQDVPSQFSLHYFSRSGASYLFGSFSFLRLFESIRRWAGSNLFCGAGPVLFWRRIVLFLQTFLLPFRRCFVG